MITPTVSVTRALRSLGLKAGIGNDFVVRGFYFRGERDHTYVILLSSAAGVAAVEHADTIVAATLRDGYVFKVYTTVTASGTTFVDIDNRGGRS